MSKRDVEAFDPTRLPDAVVTVAVARRSLWADGRANGIALPGFVTEDEVTTLRRATAQMRGAGLNPASLVATLDAGASGDGALLAAYQHVDPALSYGRTGIWFDDDQVSAEWSRLTQASGLEQIHQVHEAATALRSCLSDSVLSARVDPAWQAWLCELADVERSVRHQLKVRVPIAEPVRVHALSLLHPLTRRSDPHLESVRLSIRMATGIFASMTLRRRMTDETAGPGRWTLTWLRANDLSAAQRDAWLAGWFVGADRDRVSRMLGDMAASARATTGASWREWPDWIVGVLRQLPETLPYLVEVSEDERDDDGLIPIRPTIDADESEFL